MAIILDSSTFQLDAHQAIGNFANCLNNPAITGSFDSYLFCVANGRQIVLGHYSFELHTSELVSISSWHQAAEGSTAVFVSKPGHGNQHLTTWEDLRAALAEGYVIGTTRYPGVRIWFPSTNRNTRREPERIFVLK